MDKLFETMLTLKGKTAVITGGSSGIGAATAKLLAKAGANIVILDVNQAQGNATTDEIKTTGTKAVFLACDITDETACKAAAAFVKKEYGSVDILFNNAGVIVRKNVVDLLEKEWDAVVDVSLKGAFLVSKHMIPLMKTNGGSVINTGSGWSLKAGNDAAAYCAAKAGVLNLTRAMAIDFGKYNIRVNCICPGDTDTELLRSEAKQLGENETEFLKDASNRPLGRMGTPEDIAKSVLFLASPMSEWVSGTSLLVDGGGMA